MVEFSMLDMFIQNITAMVSVNSLDSYIVSLSVFASLVIILKIFKFVILKKLEHISKKTKSDFDDVIIKIIDDIGWPFYLLLSLYIGLQFIVLPDIIIVIVYYLTLVFALYYTTKGVTTLIDYGTKKMLIENKKKENKIDPSVVNLLNQILKAVVWFIAIIFIISNLGYDISALVAGLGIGGIAVAFALQNILSDIFAYFSIQFDKPFTTGDFIVIGKDSGTVKKIGLKSTRIKTYSGGEELVISNKELTEERVHNYKKMDTRNVIFQFGITYDTPVSKIKQIPKMITQLINKIKPAKVKYVHFKKFGDFALIFEVVYNIPTGDYETYLKIQEKINISIMELFKKNKIEMAYPTQTIYLQKVK
ncbi:mechanosensitive ion channel family protein [Candidatus Micrarchaeota archaeon]|nr:mechanosensitive ion channel family protein [Candidatus Micrarchaeota archaeon]